MLKEDFMIDLELTEGDIVLLLPALKIAESAYTVQGRYQAAKRAGKLHDSVYRQVFTYGQMVELDEPEED